MNLEHSTNGIWAMSVATAEELHAALTAVRDAARICRSVQATISADALEKRDKSPVTVADFGSQAVVCRVLGDLFPHDPIIAEEDSRELLNEQNAPFLHLIHDEICKQCIEASKEQVCRWIDRGGAEEYSHRFWTLDPIDGTKGFLRKEQYAISLALVVEGQIVLGVLGCPNLPLVPGDESTAGSIFYAMRGAGAFALPLDGEAEPQRIRVSDIGDPAQIRLCESVESGHSAHDVSAQIATGLGITRPSVRMDSQAKYACVGRGEADVYLRLPTRADYVERIWDHAGGVLVVEEAGGRVTDVAGRSLDFTHGRGLERNQGVVVTNGQLHEAVLAAVRSVGVS